MCPNDVHIQSYKPLISFGGAFKYLKINRLHSIITHSLPLGGELYLYVFLARINF